MASEQFKFVIAGGVNTLASWVVYWILLRVWEYRVAYSVGYVFGIVLAYLLNSYFVFKAQPRLRTAAVYPAIYFLQYVAGLLILWAWVDWMGLPAALGPIVVAILTLPLTFVLTRLLLKPASS